MTYIFAHALLWFVMFGQEDKPHHFVSPWLLYNFLWRVAKTIFYHSIEPYDSSYVLFLYALEAHMHSFIDLSWPPYISRLYLHFLDIPEFLRPLKLILYNIFACIQRIIQYQGCLIGQQFLVLGYDGNLNHLHHGLHTCSFQSSLYGPIQFTYENMAGKHLFHQFIVLLKAHTQWASVGASCATLGITDYHFRHTVEIIGLPCMGAHIA